MNSSGISTALVWAVRGGIWLLLFTPLIVAPGWFFPYITGKGFFFRIITEIAFGIWLALIVIDARFRPKNGIILWAFFAFIGVLTLAALFGADPYHSFWSNYERMEGLVTYLHLGALFLMASTVFRAVSDWRLTFHISAAVSLVIAGYGLFELLGLITIPGSTAGVSGIGIFSRLGNQIYLAAYLLFHFFILAFLFFTTRNIWWRAAYVLLALFEFYIFLHTGTRGALIGLVLGGTAALVVLFLCSLRDNKRLAAYTGIILIIGGAGAAGLFSLRDSSFVRQYPLLVRFADINTTSSTAQSRFMIWGIAKEAFLERPLLGWGPGNFIIPYATYYNPNLYGNEPWFDRVHNMHFEWLVAGGTLGFLAYIGVIGAMLVTVWRLWHKRILDGLAVSAVVGFLIAYLGQNTFVFDNIITYLFFVLFLALAASLRLSSVPAPNASLHYSLAAQNKRMLFAPLFIVVGILFASTVHTKQIQVAGGIIGMLNSAPAGRTVIEMTRQLDELKGKGTFGTTEARERFVDFLFAAARPSAQISSSDLSFLLSRGIEEMEDELMRNPENIKHAISLGKLYQLRLAVAGNEADYHEAVRIYEEAIQKAPRYPSTYIGLAEVYLTARETKKASDLMDAMYQEITRPNTFVYSLLSVSILDNDFERASRQVERFVSLGNTDIYPAPAWFEPEKLEQVIQRSFVSKDSRGREQFLETLLAAQEDIATFLALAETKAELGKGEEVSMLITRARNKARPDQLADIDAFESQLKEISGSSSL